MNTLSKAIVIITVILGLVWLGIFVYNKYTGGNSTLTPGPGTNLPNGQLPVNISLTEEKKIKELAENFVSGYGSYQKGNFSSLKEAEKMMTKKYQEETSRFIAEKEKEQGNAETKEYITYTGIPKQTTIISLDSMNAEASVSFEHNAFYGANLYINGELTTIDQNGNKTTQPLKRETAKKKAIIFMVKENGLWKVDSIKIE